MSTYGLPSAENVDNTPAMTRALGQIREKCEESQAIMVTLSKGRYEFYSDSVAECAYFISNHDQMNPKKVGLPFEEMKNMVFNRRGSELIFHGRMLSVSLLDSRNCVLKNFSMGFEHSQILQARVVENDTLEGGTTFEVTPWMRYKMWDNVSVAEGEGWELTPSSSIAFGGDTRHLVYDASDTPVDIRGLIEVSPRLIKSLRWRDSRLVFGAVIAMRSWECPAPNAFLYHDANMTLENIKIHYAERMGLLA